MKKRCLTLIQRLPSGEYKQIHCSYDIHICDKLLRISLKYKQIVSTMAEKLLYNKFNFLLSALVFSSKNYFKGGP